VHGRNEKLNQEKYFEKCLAAFKIPAGKKVLIKDQLESLGVTRSFLFPDLENLAKDVRAMRFVR
jgi:hypothetical protein